MKHVLILALLLPFAAAYAQISGPGSTTTSPGVITTDQAHTPNYLVTSISFTHNILALPNPTLVVGCSKNTWPRTFVTGVTVNGVPAMKMAQLKGLALNRPTDTSSWIMTRLSPGVVTINVSSTGGATNGYGVSCIAQDYYGVNQSSPVELVDTDDLPPNIVSVTCNFAPLQDGDWLVIFEYSTAYNQSSPMTALLCAANGNGPRRPSLLRPPVFRDLDRTQLAYQRGVVADRLGLAASVIKGK